MWGGHVSCAFRVTSQRAAALQKTQPKTTVPKRSASESDGTTGQRGDKRSQESLAEAVPRPGKPRTHRTTGAALTAQVHTQDPKAPTTAKIQKQVSTEGMVSKRRSPRYRSYVPPETSAGLCRSTQSTEGLGSTPARRGARSV